MSVLPSYLSRDPRLMSRAAAFAISRAAAFAILAAAGLTGPVCQADSLPAPAATNTSPWAVTSSASSTGQYKEWFPKMAAAGVTWCRFFPEWGSFEPARGKWNLGAATPMLDAADANQLHISGMFLYSTDWAAPPGGGSHAYPMTHLSDWADYIRKVVGFYKDRIHYWEVWNEPNGSFKGPKDTTEGYATIVARAYAAAKESDPNAQIGISVASYDAPFIDQVVADQAKMEAPESFDYLCIHPYETIGGLSEADGEIPYLWMARMLRDELQVDAPGRRNPEIWITEVGRRIGDKKESNEADVVTEKDAASTLVKGYIMAIAQGIQHICWFEAQDPSGEPPGYGILRIDGGTRPSWDAMRAMTSTLGETPKYLGWLALGQGGRSYGFVFQGAAPVLVIWMPHGETDNSVAFASNVQLIDAITGNHKILAAGQALPLTDSPVMVAGLPPGVAMQARANSARNFPWGGDYSGATSVGIQLGDPNVNKGVMQVEREWTTPYKFDDGTTGALVSPPGKHDNQNIKFIVHPSFASLKTRDYYIRVTARRTGPSKAPDSYCKMDLVYEVADSNGHGPIRIAGRDMSGGDLTGYKGEVKGDTFELAETNPGWQTHTWHVTDASFAKMWDYDIAFLIDKSDPFVVGKVEVSTRPFAN